jgi:uncharacterized C2H2 Zn-finger protein
MPPYICYFCNKLFSQKGILRKHFNKTKKCKFNKYDSHNKLKTEMSHEDVIILFEVGEYHNLFCNSVLHPFAPKLHPVAPICTHLHPICTHLHPICTQIAPICAQISKKTNNELVCDHCSMVFTRKSSKKRHINENHCNILKNNTQITNCNNTNNNITINTQNTQNTQNNQNNIHINCYGKEDLSYITKDVLQDIMNQPLTGIPKLIEMIHLNPNHPENNNIKLVNKNLPFLNYYNGEFWKTADKSKVLGNLLKSKTEITDEFYKNSEINMEDTPYPKYSDAIRYVVTNFEFEDPLLKYKPSKKAMTEIYKKLEKDLYTMILNHRDYVKDICEA